MKRQVTETITVWLLVSDDEYELPLVIADSVPQLASKIGVSENTIRSAWAHYVNGNRKHTRYQKVEWEEKVMKPIESIPETIRKGSEKAEARRKEIQEFIDSGAEYAEVAMITGIASYERSGYEGAVKSMNVKDKVAVHRRQNKIYLEKLQSV